ncbi:MAG: gamma-glutamyl-gamma-aminobutyrate hydrolase family protein, partial [Shewanella sp.]
ERLVMDWSVQHGYPLIGVCRGMQAMLLYKGAQLRPCLGQVCAQQQILFCQQVIKVNSYHQFECINIPAEFEVIGTGDNGMVKAVKGKQLSWLAIMWHPERLMPQRKQDLQLFNQFLTQGAVCKD